MISSASIRAMVHTNGTNNMTDANAAADWTSREGNVATDRPFAQPAAYPPIRSAAAKSARLNSR
jgi:hypothetical protein